MARIADPALRSVGRLVEEGFNTRNVALIERAIGPHCLQHGTWLGRTDLRQRLRFLLEVLPDARLRLEDHMVEGDRVACRWAIDGTHLGEYMRIPPTGRAVTFRGLTVATVKDGKVSEYWEFPDTAGFYAQLTADVEDDVAEAPEAVPA